jgi:flagellar biosynthetic protein FliQ
MAREALLTALLLSAPALMAGAAVGLIVGLLQAVTQVHDPTLAFVPKLVAILAVLGVMLPWLMQHLLQYAGELFAHAPYW